MITVSNSSEWKMRRLKTVASVMPSNVDKLTDPDDPPVRLCNYVDVYKNDLITGDMDFMPATATKAQIERFSLRAGDVLITKDSETPADIAVPAHVEESAAGIVCGYHLALLRPNLRQTHGKYLFWALRSAPVSASFTVRAQGITRFGLTISAMGDVLIPLPSLSTQRAIANFLDRETAKIDGLIAKQTEFLAKLDEHRRALVTEAVTHGLDASVPMKETGIASLPSIPAHWTVVPLRWLISIESGMAPPSQMTSEVQSGENPIPMIGGNGIMGYVNSTNVNTQVLAVGRVGALCGNVHSVSPPAWITDNALVVEASAKVDINFLRLALDAMDLNQFANKSAQPLITGSMIKAQFLLLPPLCEQAEIVRYLDRHLMGLDKLRAKSAEMIERFRERRSALITAAATGQIDVTDPALNKAAA